MEAKGEIVLVGGRFSRHIAGMLAGYLVQFRSGASCDVGVLSPQTFHTLADLGRRDVLVVFDYRRYQLDVMAYASQAAALDVRILLFTDQWLSPITDLAENHDCQPARSRLALRHAGAGDRADGGASPPTSVSTLGDDARVRIERIEKVRHANAVTLDSDPQENGKRQTGPGKTSEPRKTPGPKSAKQDDKA